MTETEPNDDGMHIDLPPSDQADFVSLRTALIEAAKGMIDVGYHPGQLAAALVATGASLAYDIDSGPLARMILDRVRQSVDNVAAGSPLEGPVAGTA